MMLQYVLSDLRNRTGKFVFLILSLAVGVSAVVGIIQVNLLAQEDFVEQLSRFGANVVIYPDAEQFNLNYGGLSLASVAVKEREIQEEYISKIYEIENNEEVKIVSPKVLGVVAIEDESFIVVGVANFSEELRLKTWWSFEGEIPQEGKILIGSSVANRTGAIIGSQLTLSSKSDKSIVVEVSGILDETASQDDNAVFLNLGEAQFLLDKYGEVSLIEVAAFCEGCPVEAIVEQIQEAIPGTKGVAAKQLMYQQMYATQKFTQFGMSVSGFILLLSIIGLYTSLISFVKDKNKEIAILKSVGFRIKDVYKILALEIGIVAILGSLGGFTGGQSIALLLSTFLSLPYSMNLFLMAIALGISVIVGFISIIGPMRHIAKLSIIECFREL